MEKKTSLYFQLANNILNKITEGIYKVEDKLPTERDLSEKYKLSRATVRQALLHLEREGHIYKIQGSGTFVAPKLIEQSLLKFYSFSEEMKNQGKVPRSEIVSFNTITFDNCPKLFTNMKLKINEELFELRRVMFADNKPMMYERTFLPKSRFIDLTKEKLVKRSLYDLLVTEYDVKFKKAEENFQPVNLTEQEAAYLHTDPSDPSMKIERFTYEGNNIIECSISIVSNKFKYKITLENKS